MKKLIAISVVFALVAGVAFAVDLGGAVIGTVNVIQASSGSGSAVTGSAKFNRIRIDGGGEVADGKFGGWLRFDRQHWDGALAMAGNAWWKPIDQLKLGIGGNPDGLWGQEGNSGWMFTQGVTDTDVADSGDNTWGKTFKTRNAFFGGFGDNRLFIEITPVDMVGINIAIPFFKGGNMGDIFKGTLAQVALNLSFGSFAFTFNGDLGDPDHGRDPDIMYSQVFGFFSLTAVDNLQIDFGLGANFLNTSPLNLGFAVKYSGGSWGIKFRSMFGIPTRSGNPFGMLFDVLPYFVINDSFRVFVSAGVNIADIDDLTAAAGWRVNPYIEIGEEWGPKFFAGIKVYSDAFSGSPAIKFDLPIALAVSF